MTNKGGPLVRTNCLSMILETDVAEHHGIAWRLELAEPDPHNPLVKPAFPWDSGAFFAHGTVLRDPIDGLWKAWNISTKEDLGDFEAGRRLTYAVSKDGVNWDRPLLDIIKQPGYPKTNILLDFSSGGTCMYASVIVHPKAKHDFRYEMFILRFPGHPEGSPQQVGNIPLEPGSDKHPYGIYRYWSADGIRWNAAEGPIVVTASPGERMVIPYDRPDNAADNALIHHMDDGTYVLYSKIGEPIQPGGFVPYDIFSEGRRVLARRTSPDGSTWSPLETILQPDWRDPQDLQFMELGLGRVTEGFLGVLTCYHNLAQTTDLQLAGSADGRTWSRPSREPTIPVRRLGDYGGGMLWATRELVEHEGRMYVYYAASEGLHGDPFSTQSNIYPFHAALCRASWEVDRYWAAVSAAGGIHEASITSFLLPIGGQQLNINAVTATVGEGELTAELLDPEGRPIEGFSRSDYEPWNGDSKAMPVKWAGGEKCPIEYAAVRFYIKRARLYGFGWL